MDVNALVDVDGHTVSEASDDERLLPNLNNIPFLLASTLERKPNVELDTCSTCLLGHPMTLIDV